MDSESSKAVAFAAIGAAALGILIGSVMTSKPRRSKTGGNHVLQSLAQDNKEGGDEGGDEPEHRLKPEAKLQLLRSTSWREPAKEGAPIYTVVLTGGPCGGKSSSLKHVVSALTKKGFDVYTAPEVPTILMNGGCRYPGRQPENRELLREYETDLLKLQIQMEDSFLRIARKTCRPAVVVFDRGCLDVSAYISKVDWEQVLADNNWTRESMLARYDLVLHLVSAANGAEEFYTTANNTARKSTLEQARALDNTMQACWAGHERFKTVDNSTGFKAKLARVTRHVLELVGEDPEEVVLVDDDEEEQVPLNKVAQPVTTGAPAIASASSLMLPPKGRHQRLDSDVPTGANGGDMY